jgi:uncharacterized protein YjbJ (UPF0337 family)
MDRAKGQMKEAAGALTGDKDTKAEGRTNAAESSRRRRAT